MNKEAFKNQEHYTAADLYELLQVLRAPDGCPWDRVQTHRSVRRGVIEEAYEVAEAIDRDDTAMMVEELGDLLMQVYFHICIGEEEGRFTQQDVYDRVCKKLIFRHPHLFDNAPDATGSTEEGWARLKRLEKGQTTLYEDLDGIAKSLPALTRAEKMAGKVEPSPDAAKLLHQLNRQVQELEQQTDTEKLGQVLFTLCRLAKAKKIDPEYALHLQNEACLGQNR